MLSRNLSRRDFLRLAGLGLAGSYLSACAPEAPASAAAWLITETSPTAPANPTASATSQPSLTALKVEAILPATSTPAPTQAPPTQAPSPSPTLAPGATLRPATDVLTQAQKKRLASAALRYIAADEVKAIQVARSLGYLDHDGHPASVCGPLAAAILRDAGLLSQYVDLHEFWLLNPRTGQSVLERNFPRDAFIWYQTSQSTADYDFGAFPLKAGDFVYLYAGDPGSFEHMLIVSRLDEQGRPYAVTNINTPQGYVIQETLLYDPARPGVGQFYDWTDRKKNGRLGLTGFGGFLLIRFQTPVIDPGPQEIALAQAVDGIVEKYGGDWRIYIKEIGGPVVYARRERYTLHPASVIKVPIAMLFFKSLEQAGVIDYTPELKKGVDGRSYQQLLKAMLVNSEEKAATSLEQDILTRRLDEFSVLESWGAPHTYIAIRQSTAYEMAILFEGLFSGRCVEAAPRQMILDYLAVYSSGDNTRLGVIRKHLPDGYPFYNKRGTITAGLLVVADTAIVKLPTRHGDKLYVIAAFAYQGKNATTYNRLETALGILANQLWQYTQDL